MSAPSSSEAPATAEACPQTVETRAGIDNYLEDFSLELANILSIRNNPTSSQLVPRASALPKPALPGRASPRKACSQDTLICEYSASNALPTSIDIGPYNFDINRRDVAARKKFHPEKDVSARGRGRDLPTEVLDMVVKNAIEMSSNNIKTLRRLSLVCRTWHHHCAPRLYRNIRIGLSQIGTFYNDVRSPHCLARPHITRLTLRMDSAANAVDSVHLGRVSRVLGSALTQLRIGTGQDELLSEDELQRRIPHSMGLAGACATFSALTYLELHNMSFSSSQDLLRLLGSLPSLTKAGLNHVYWRKSITLAPFHRLSKLVRIHFAQCTAVWPFMLCVAYSRSFSEFANNSFAGLSREEALIAAHICQHTLTADASAKMSWLQFEKSPYPQMYTATVRSQGDGLLEFHIQQPEVDSPIAASRSAFIRWIVFGGVQHGTDELGRGYFPSHKDIQSINELLSQLPHLDKVVLESYSDETTSSMNEIAGLLSNVATKIHPCTWREAENYGKDACIKGFPSNDSWLPIAPWRWGDIRKREEQRKRRDSGRRL